jgi:hypothetical protein
MTWRVIIGFMAEIGKDEVGHQYKLAAWGCHCLGPFECKLAARIVYAQHAGSDGIELPPARTCTMTTTDRVAALRALYSQLDAITTTEEDKLYPALQHLGDLIEDLQLEIDD